MTSLVGSSAGSVSPFIWRTSSAASRNPSAALATSPVACASGLPCSWLSVRAIRARLSSIEAAMATHLSARFHTDVFAHPARASLAAAIASRAMARSLFGSQAICFPVAGFIAGVRSGASVQRPSMKFCNVSMKREVLPIRDATIGRR